MFTSGRQWPGEGHWKNYSFFPTPCSILRQGSSYYVFLSKWCERKSNRPCCHEAMPEWALHTLILHGLPPTFSSAVPVPRGALQVLVTSFGLGVCPWGNLGYNTLLADTGWIGLFCADNVMCTHPSPSMHHHKYRSMGLFLLLNSASLEGRDRTVYFESLAPSIAPGIN